MAANEMVMIFIQNFNFIHVMRKQCPTTPSQK